RYRGRWRPSTPPPDRRLRTRPQSRCRCRLGAAAGGRAAPVLRRPPATPDSGLAALPRPLRLQAQGRRAIWNRYRRQRATALAFAQLQAVAIAVKVAQPGARILKPDAVAGGQPRTAFAVGRAVSHPDPRQIGLARNFNLHPSCATTGFDSV